MAAERVLIVDDEVFIGSPTDDKLARKIKTYLKNGGFEVEFVPMGEAALERISADADKEIKLVLLDIRFTGIDTAMQGPEIFKKIQDLRWDLPIVIITNSPVRKLTGEIDVFNDFIELGASLFIEKKYFAKRGREQIDYITSLARKDSVEYTLEYKRTKDHKNNEILLIEITWKDGDQKLSILKNPYPITGDIGIFVEECIDNFPEFVHWKTVNAKRYTDFSDIGFHKAVHKLNDMVMRSSAGRIPALLERGGRAGCRLNIHSIEEMG